eukprot:scaffold41224_cov229-Amphora_coffeaeformis.AAC.1
MRGCEQSTKVAGVGDEDEGTGVVLIIVVVGEVVVPPTSGNDVGSDDTSSSPFVSRRGDDDSLLLLLLLLLPDMRLATKPEEIATAHTARIPMKAVSIQRFRFNKEVVVVVDGSVG